MPFRLARDPQFTHKIAVSVPIDGGYREETMRVRYRYVPEPDLAAIYVDHPADGDVEVARQIVVSIDDLVDEDKQPLDCTSEVMERVFALTYARGAIIRGYYNAMTKARAGN